jgi:outer membrane lipoprotein-sorting protein
MTLNKFFVLLVSFLIMSQGFAQIPGGYQKLEEAGSFKNKVVENAKLTESLSSDFTQEKHLTMMEEVLVSKGRFLFKKENKVRWEYDSPINYTILINENHFIIDNDGKVSTFDTESNKLFKEINNMILMAIRGNFVNDSAFEARYYSNDNYYLAVLNPRDKILKNILDQIEIYFDKKGMDVDKVKFVEPEDDFTLITFTDRKKNIKIEDDQFTIQE